MRHPKDQAILFLNAINTAMSTVYSIDWLYMAVFSKNHNFVWEFPRKTIKKIKTEIKILTNWLTDCLPDIVYEIVKLC